MEKKFWQGYWKFSQQWFGKKKSDSQQRVPEELLDAAACAAQFSKEQDNVWKVYDDEFILIKCDVINQNLYVDLKKCPSQQEEQCVLAVRQGHVLLYLRGIWEHYVLEVVAKVVEEHQRSKSSY